MIFERLPISDKTGQSPEKSSKATESVQATTKKSLRDGDRLAIFGSVSTMDVANHIRDHVSYNDEAAMIQMSEANVKFIDLPADEDPTRVKHLGEYKVQISFKGTEATLLRKLAVSKPKEQDGDEVVDPALTTTPADDLIEANKRAGSS